MALAALCGAASVLPAQPAPLPMMIGLRRSFSSMTWNTESGLPQNSVTSILIARDGFVWIGTFGGLCRFDGQELRTFQASSSALPQNRITALAETVGGRIWIATEHRGLAVVEGGSLRAVAATAELRVLALHAMPDDSLLIGTIDGLFRLAGDTLTRLDTDLREIRKIRLLRDGRVLIASQHGLFEVVDGRFRRLTERQCLAISQQHGDRIWFCQPDGLYELVGDRAVPRQASPMLQQACRDLCVTEKGELWLASNSGAICVDTSLSDADLGSRMVPIRRSGTNCEAIVADPAGGIWIGYSQYGLQWLLPTDLEVAASVPSTTGAGPNVVLPLGGRTALIGTQDGVYMLGEGGARPDPRWPRDLPTYGLARAEDGTIWAGHEGQVSSVDGSGIRFLRDDIPDGQVRALLCAQDRVWLGTSGGLRIVQQGRVVLLPALEPFRHRSFKVIVPAPDGAVWASSTHELLRIDPDGGVRTWRSGLELPIGEVRAIFPLAGPEAWIGTYGTGLLRLRGDTFESIEESHGLFDNAICNGVDLGDQFALGCNRGFCLVDKQVLDEFVQGGRSELYYRPLRLQQGSVRESQGGMQPTAATDGTHLWFCGLSSVLVAALPVRTIHEAPPNCHILDPLTGAASDGGMLELPLGMRTVGLRLAGCSLEFPELLRFRWRIRGPGQHSATWREGGRQRLLQTPLLDPGEHVFEVVAVDIADQAGTAPVSIRISVPPYVHETMWFRTVVVVVLLLAGYGLVRFTSWRAIRRAAAMRLLVDERTAQLREARENLEHRVEQRTQELNEALENSRRESAERGILERQVQQLQRMESLGQLAGGIAHDFNNLLTVILGCSSMLERELADDPELLEIATSLRDAGERGRRLTHHLLAVASRQMVVPEVLDLDQIVAELEVVLRPMLGGKIELQIVRARAPALVRAARTQIEQILMNLCVNARDAMPEGGLVRIEIEPPTQTGGRVVLAVSDNGCGMSDSVRERAFEPFFTTKPRGSGTGLGLSTVYGIVKQLGGDIGIDSRVGHGTEILITLPANDATLPKSVVLQPAPAEPLPSTRVLLIEDEESVRRVMRRTLEQLGVVVTEACNGADAVARLAAAPDTIDVVLSDVLMPGLMGMALVRELRRIRPGLPVVFVSGYTDDTANYQELRDAGLQLLPKPPVTRQLRDALARAARQAREQGAARAVADGGKAP